MKFTVEIKDNPSANHRRGYHNYDMHVTFEPGENGYTYGRDRQKKYLDMFFNDLQPNNMWCHQPKLVEEKLVEDTDWPLMSHWVINFGYDSGD